MSISGAHAHSGVLSLQLLGNECLEICRVLWSTYCIVSICWVKFLPKCLLPIQRKKTDGDSLYYCAWAFSIRKTTSLSKLTVTRKLKILGFSKDWVSLVKACTHFNHLWIRGWYFQSWSCFEQPKLLHSFF